ncbi:MAG: PaaI family thioesterase [Gammaproteobacteria bacterium]|nr:PaaI family thioesterase [Gammaproteobacteria bacterium]
MEIEIIRKRQQELLDLFDTAPIKRAYNMQFHYTEQGNAVFTLPYNPNFDHALGGIHGGVLATMLDNAGWFTAATRYNFWIATSDLQVRLLLPAIKTTLMATGRLLKAGSRMAVSEMEVKSENGDLISIGSGSFVVTSQKC